jgi:hypothetical protein
MVWQQSGRIVDERVPSPSRVGGRDNDNDDDDVQHDRQSF